MPFTKLTELTNLIADLPDLPNDTMTSTQLKQYWDSSPEELRVALNKLMDELQATTSASNLGAKTITGISGGTVQALLENLKAYIDNLKVYVDAHKNDKANPHQVTADQLNVYTKEELAPYLQGGETFIKYEVFTIVSSNNGDGTFNYKDRFDQLHTGEVTEEGYQVFTLREGNYTIGENRINAIVGDVLHRSVASGGLQEISPTEVALTIPEGDNAEITFQYFGRVGIAGEHNLIVGPDRPPVLDSKTVWFQVVG